MRYAFGDYVFDSMLLLLLHNGAQLTVPRRVYACLTHLIEHRERVIKRDELIRKVWGRDNVSDHQMAQVIRAARQALGDDGNCQCMIRTVMGVGYHWAADVVELSGTETPAVKTPERAPAIQQRNSEPVVSTNEFPAESPIVSAMPVVDGDALPASESGIQNALAGVADLAVALSQRSRTPNPRLRLALAMTAGVLLGTVGTHQVMLHTTVDAPSSASIPSVRRELDRLPASDETVAQKQVQFTRTGSPSRN